MSKLSKLKAYLGNRAVVAGAVTVGAIFFPKLADPAVQTPLVDAVVALAGAAGAIVAATSRPPQR